MNEFLRKAYDSAKDIIERCSQLDELIAAPEIIADTALYLRICRQKDALSKSEALSKELIDKQAFVEECVADYTNTLTASELENLQDEVYELAICLARELSCGGDIDRAVIEIRAVCGAKSKEFAQDICKAYQRLSANNAWDCSENIQDDTVKQQSKTVRLNIVGSGVLRTLNQENGVHKLADGKSVSDVFVYVLDSNALVRDIYAYDDKDLRIDYFHSSGAGGQNINKVETAVRVTHLPSGMSVVCQDERSQLKNKRRALQNMRDKLVQKQAKEQEKAIAAQRADIEKIYRNQPPSRVYNIADDAAVSRDGTKHMLSDVFAGNPQAFAAF